MARSSRWRDAAAQAQSQPASPAPDAPAHPMPPVNAPVAGPPMPPFAPPVPVAGPSPRINPFAPPAPPAPPAAPVAAVASASELPEPPAPSAPSATPSPPPTSSAPTAGSPVEADVAELRATLQQLQTTVSALVERSHEPSVPTGTPGTDQASRILVMANRAAESTLEEARAEAAEILAAAQAHSVEIISAARELADQELAAERVRVAAATSEWTERRAQISAHLRDLDAALNGYRDGLGETATAIREAAVRLEAERAEPPVIDELPAPDPAAFVSAHLAPNPDAVVDLTDAPEPGAVADTSGDSADSSDSADSTDELAASPRTSLFGGAVATGVPGGPLAAEAPADAAVAPPEPPVADDAPVEEPPSRNLRPGLFGR
ncbi:MAG TPA: hypothetical protein PKY13_05140 [Microthrixaceae bacterium]|nr:hypothetical protein [Microthrixaceae bacterium]HQF94545.1 hypothetical protein [Microthrixaceae bacterium]